MTKLILLITFWNSINSLKNNNNKYPSPISLEEWVDHYKSLLNTHLEGNTPSDLENTKENFCQLNYSFTFNEVKKGIKKLKIGKAIVVQI